MDPLSVLPIVDEEDIDILNTPENDDEELQEVNQQTIDDIQTLQGEIHEFKRRLYRDLILEDTRHDSSDLGGMMTFHALFLQCVGYWIGCLDSVPVPMPKFAEKQMTAIFLDLTKQVETIRSESLDARVLLYSMLFNFSIQHPYNLGESKKKAV